MTAQPVPFVAASSPHSPTCKKAGFPTVRIYAGATVQPSKTVRTAKARVARVLDGWTVWTVFTLRDIHVRAPVCVNVSHLFKLSNCPKRRKKQKQVAGMKSFFRMDGLKNTTVQTLQPSKPPKEPSHG